MALARPAAFAAVNMVVTLSRTSRSLIGSPASSRAAMSMERMSA